MLNFHRERWNPVKNHLKALVFFAVSKQIPIVYSADYGRAETSGLGLDAMSLTWPTVVQLVVSFNSGLQRGISQEYSFFVSSQGSI